jgi:hypothetical protein
MYFVKKNDMSIMEEILLLIQSGKLSTLNKNEINSKIEELKEELTNNSKDSNAALLLQRQGYKISLLKANKSITIDLNAPEVEPDQEVDESNKESSSDSSYSPLTESDEDPNDSETDKNVLIPYTESEGGNELELDKTKKEEEKRKKKAEPESETIPDTEEEKTAEYKEAENNPLTLANDYGKALAAVRALP